MRTSPRTRPEPAPFTTRPHAPVAAVPDPEPQRRRHVDAYWTPLVIRLAVAADVEALLRLAALDSARPPAGDTVVAEQGGSLVAAVSLSDGRAIADPFRPTADIVGLLHTRAGQLQRAGVTPAA